MAINIVRNTSFYTFALLMQKVVSLTYFTLLARYLPPEDLGKYYFAISFSTLIGIFIDVGFSTILTREIAKFDTTKEPNIQRSISRIFGSVLTIKIILAIVSLLGLFILVNLFDYTALVKNLIYMAAISMVLDSFTLSFYAVMRGMHNINYESIGVFVFQLVILSVGYYGLRANLGLKWLMFAIVSASVFSFSFSFFSVLLRFRINIIPTYDRHLIHKIIVLGVPFALFNILKRVYLFLDSILLKWLVGDKFVGLYQVPFKFMFALQFIPIAFTASLFPALSSYWLSDKEKMKKSFSKAINYLLIISLPISATLIILAKDIVTLFRPEYAEAIFPIQIVFLSLPFIYLNFVLVAFLNACDHQRSNTVIMTVGLAASILSNIVLIPKLQVLGAGLTVLWTNGLMFFLGIRHISTIIHVDFRTNMTIVIKVLFSIIIMGISLLFLQKHVNLFVNCALSGITYLGSLFLFKGLTIQEMKHIIGSFRTK